MTIDAIYRTLLSKHCEQCEKRLMLWGDFFWSPTVGAALTCALVAATFLLTFSCMAVGQAASTATMNGTVSASAVQAGAAQANTATLGSINNVAQVDGITNTSLAGAVGSSQCYGAGTTPSFGCVIWDGFNEGPFQVWPFLGSHFYRLNMGHGTPFTSFGDGTWWTTAPIVVSTGQIMGSGRVNSSETGSTGTVFRACDGSTTCNGLYFPNAPPPPNPTWTTVTGTLSSGTYLAQISWVVNLATGPDSRPTGSWSPYPSSATLIYPGYAVTDAGSPTQCTSSPPCTWMALNAGTATSTVPSWTGSAGTKVTDSTTGITWLNLGNIGASNSYGTPGLSLPSTAATFSNTMNNGGFKISAIPTPSYPTCTSMNGMLVSDGTYVTGPGTGSSQNSHLYRSVGSGTLNTGSGSCNTSSMNTSPGSQSQDQGAPGIYWQEVGPTSSPSLYLPILGYMPYVSPNNGLAGSEIARTGLCSTTQTVGSLTYCPLTATFQVTTNSQLNAGGNHSPMIDTTHALIVLGEKQNNASGDTATFMTRAQDLTADANNIAGEACLYVYAQEQSGCYAVNAISGTEATIAAIGPGGSDSMLWDFTAGNPASGNKQQQRVAGVFLDARDGEPMRTVLDGTITPYNSPTAPTSNSVPYGLWFVGGSNITIESVHTEAVQDGIFCEGDPSKSNFTAGCWILSTDPGGGGSLAAPENNAVHIGTQVGSGFVNVEQSNATNALKDDTVNNANVYTASGTYTLGGYDSAGHRMTLVSQPAALQVFDGPLFLNNASTSPSASAGALGFAQGLDVSSPSLWPTNTAIIEAPTSVSSYRLALPAGPSSGILQTANFTGGSFPQLTGSFSGDSTHSSKSTGNSGTAGGSLCSSGCTSGLYHVYWAIVQATACTGSTGTVAFQLTWTDHSSHTTTLPMTDGTTLAVPSGLTHLQVSSLASPASGDFNVVTNGSQISYNTLVSSCTGGTYDIYVTATQLQ